MGELILKRLRNREVAIETNPPKRRKLAERVKSVRGYEALSQRKNIPADRSGTKILESNEKMDESNEKMDDNRPEKSKQVSVPESGSCSNSEEKNKKTELLAIATIDFKEGDIVWAKLKGLTFVYFVVFFKISKM